MTSDLDRTTRGDEMESPAVPGPYVTGRCILVDTPQETDVVAAWRRIEEEGMQRAAEKWARGDMDAGPREGRNDDGEWAEKPCPQLAQAGQVSNLYAGLHGVLSDAYHQAAGGKGKERHATNEPFEDQPIMVITRLLADHPVSALGYQAIKKTVEAGRLHRTKGPDAAIRELHGAINYIAAMVIRVREMGDIRDSRTQDGARG